jgi:hypothetical protein
MNAKRRMVYDIVQFAVEIIGNTGWGMQWRYPIEQCKKTEYISKLQDG